MQKKINLLLLLLLITSGLYAKESGISSSVSLVGMSMDYREYDDGGTLLDSEKSGFADLTGAEMSLEYVFARDASAYNQIAVNLMLLSGETAYKGSAFGSNDSYGSLVGTTVNTLIDTDISYTHGNTFSNNFELNYGVGFGYRYWKRALSASQVETYKWYSLRPMVGVDYAVNKRLNIGLNFEYQYGITPIMNESAYSYDFTLGRADIIEVSLPINYKYNDKLSMFVEYTFEQQSIEKSNTIQRVIGVDTWKIWEPDSTANNQYLKLGMAFKF